MHSKRNSYSGYHNVEPASTIKRRKERATQKAKQDNQVVETPYESVGDKRQTAITEIQGRSFAWWLGSSCIVIPFMVLIAYAVRSALRVDLVDLEGYAVWLDWRFMVPFVVFTSQAFLGLRGGRYRFWLAFPFIVVIVLMVYLFWMGVIGNYEPKFWQDWRFIVPFVVFNSQAFLGLKNGWESCLLNLLRFCFIGPAIVAMVSGGYALLFSLTYGDSREFQWWNWQNIALMFLTYYLVFLGLFGFLEKWLSNLERKIKTIIRRRTDVNKKE